MTRYAMNYCHTLRWLSTHKNKETNEYFLPPHLIIAAEKFIEQSLIRLKGYRLQNWSNYVDKSIYLGNKQTEMALPLWKNFNKALEILGDLKQFTYDACIENIPLGELEKNYCIKRREGKHILKNALEKLADFYEVHEN